MLRCRLLTVCGTIAGHEARKLLVEIEAVAMMGKRSLSCRSAA